MKRFDLLLSLWIFCEIINFLSTNFILYMRKLIVVSGGTKGIGRAILEKFAARDFDLVTCSRNADDLNTLTSEIQSDYYHTQIHSLRADLSKKSEVEKFVSFIRGLERPVDVLVNNTGLFIPGQVHTEEEGSLENMINTNLYSAYYLTRGLIGDMKEKKHGHIFNMCSTASITPYVNGGSYCISKYALLGMSKVLREEMKGFNVRVTSVMPGATLTASWEGTDLPPERFMKPEDVAAAVWAAYSLSPQTVLEELVIRPQLGDI